MGTHWGKQGATRHNSAVIEPVQVSYPNILVIARLHSNDLDRNYIKKAGGLNNKEAK